MGNEMAFWQHILVVLLTQVFLKLLIRNELCFSLVLECIKLFSQRKLCYKSNQPFGVQDIEPNIIYLYLS